MCVRILICGMQNLGDADALVIAQHLNRFKRLRTLNMVSCGSAGLCCAACRVTHALQGGNQVGAQGAAALADSLKTNNCLTELNLVSERSRDVGQGLLR